MALDHHTKDGAERLADVIRTYWGKRGKTVSVWLEEEGFTPAMREGYWVIRSDIGQMLGPKDRNIILGIDMASGPDKHYEINMIRMRLPRIEGGNFDQIR